MKKIFLLLSLLLPLLLSAQPFTQKEITDWKKQAQQVNIIRDNWGIPHVYGKTDADAVFGLMYAQCEDDFKRVEMNYIDKLGRVSETTGEKSLAVDLLNKALFDSAESVKDYEQAPDWMKKLCNAFADGINYYLYTHPGSKPLLLKRFKPWYPFLWTDGSINAINIADIKQTEFSQLYLQHADRSSARINPNEESPLGSNGFAISSMRTKSENAMLYINPHVTFYFRPEVQMVSEEGLNVYGAVTWGQFFVYQGFNAHCGWMHTSSAVDAADTYAENLTKAGKGWTYLYDGKQLPVKEKKIQLHYRSGNEIKTKLVTVLYTHHGPIMANRNGQWLSMRADNRLSNGLMQCWLRNKANSFNDFKKTLDLLGNISNNTVYADAEGNIAYWHGNRIPARNPKYDWTKPVDGTTSATEWKGQHTVNEIVQSINPPNGWLQNCNSTPFTVAGEFSPKRDNYPAYMAPDGENFRGINAVKVLDKEKAYTLDKLIAAGYDTYLAAFENLVPALVSAFERNNKPGDSLYPVLAEPIALMKEWDLHSDVQSVATTLAIEWGDKLLPIINALALPKTNADFVDNTRAFAATAKPDQLLIPFVKVIRDLDTRFGTWQVPLGDINRYQRISGDINQQYRDDQPSLPVGFVSSQWGMLPSYTSTTFPPQGPAGGTRKRYGLNGNSFICAVEFGEKIKAKSLLAGGESGDPSSKHFNDQMEMYSKGLFKDVLFYKEDLLKHVERNYHPGE